MVEGVKMMAIQVTEGQYQRLGEMSVDSLQNSSCYGGGYVSVSSHSSVGSNSIMASLIQRTRDRTRRGLTAGSVVHPGVVHTGLGDDALVQALMDDRYPTEGLKEYIDWTIDLRSLNMGPAFAQGAFGKLFKATYKGEDVAVKILERPQNDDEKAQVLNFDLQFGNPLACITLSPAMHIQPSRCTYGHRWVIGAIIVDNYALGDGRWIWALAIRQIPVYPLPEFT